jgi:hypothetical protein
MYAVYYEHPDGRLEWIAEAASESQARAVGRLWSKLKPLEVVVIENLPEGATTHLDTYARGRAAVADRA